MAAKEIAINRKAFHDYEILERVEAGLVLTGTEIKSIRAGRVNIRDSYARPQEGELWLHNTHIAQYPGGGPWNHDPIRPRKLLLHAEQIARLSTKVVSEKGLTLVPLRLYVNDHRAKVELALVRGRKKYDKRKVIATREADREMARALRRRR